MVFKKREYLFINILIKELEMANVEYYGEYDPELNIVFTKFINKPKNSEDVDVFVDGNKEWFAKGGKNKVWNITDISKMGMASVSVITEYQKKAEPLLDMYLIDYCVVCSSALEKITVNLFNILMGQKRPIFKTREEATEWVLKEQKTQGRFVPI